MANHISLGKMGEHLAVAYLKRKGFHIMHQNWRHGHCEIDIIATKEEVLHFIEVKTRRNLKFGFPEEGVTPQKLSKLTQAAEEFQYQNPGWKIIQFDILSIMLYADGREEFFFIEDIDL